MPSDYTNFAANAVVLKSCALPALGRAVIGKILPCLALQVAILVAAVGIEVGVLGKINAQRLVNVVILKAVIGVCLPAFGGITVDRNQVVRRTVI
jgi:hypothetical protein